jgi:hypothetical protein
MAYWMHWTRTKDGEKSKTGKGESPEMKHDTPLDCHASMCIHNPLVTLETPPRLSTMRRCGSGDDACTNRDLRPRKQVSACGNRVRVEGDSRVQDDRAYEHIQGLRNQVVLKLREEAGTCLLGRLKPSTCLRESPNCTNPPPASPCLANHPGASGVLATTMEDCLGYLETLESTTRNGMVLKDHHFVYTFSSKNWLCISVGC